MGPNGTATVPPLHAEMSPDKNTAFGPLPVIRGAEGGTETKYSLQTLAQIGGTQQDIHPGQCDLDSI